MARNLFCFGFGYSAAALARRLSIDGWRVAGTARSDDKTASLQREGFTAFTFDGLSWPDALDAALAEAEAILISTPPTENGDPVLHIGAGRLRAVKPRWLGYLSSTGVYGDRQGEWVDETATPAPSSPRSQKRLEAELAWRDFAGETSAPLHIFRIAGIYGPERNALESLLAGTARRFEKPGQIFSRIHVDDLAAVLAASIAKPSPGAIYNVCDDEPASQADVVAFGAELLGMPPPPLEKFADAEPGLSEMAKSFYRDSKRVRNDKMKRQLGVTLAYPTYREGLESLK
ncbi:MAG TPA: SDR family oxidoreductase [Rhizomicrobium sp.]|nr:SDR family oxidoreductase [Rhizomicrobium sp.]